MSLVFVVGTGRCGSTLVHEVLAAHEALGFVSNVEDRLPHVNTLGRFNSTLYATPLGRFTAKGRPRFAPSEAYRLAAREVSPVYQDSCRDLTADDVTAWLEERFRAFFERRRRAQRKPLFLHKYTGWPRLGFFHRIFPEARFIHVVRDGRAVANSWLKMPWWCGYRGPENWRWGPLPEPYRREWERGGRAFHLLAAIAWKILMEAFERAEAQLPEERCLRLRFEDIVAAPEERFTEMLAFCGLGWSPALARRLAQTSLRRDTPAAYTRDLTPAQVADMERSLDPMLRRYGYL